MNRSSIECSDMTAIELTPEGRMRLDRQINDRMAAKGLGRLRYNDLGLGFKLPLNWPGDKDCEITIGQLIAIAHRLDMRIIINNLDLIPRRSD